jgi:hypothetical protein
MNVITKGLIAKTDSKKAGHLDIGDHILYEELPFCFLYVKTFHDRVFSRFVNCVDGGMIEINNNTDVNYLNGDIVDEKFNLCRFS